LIRNSVGGPVLAHGSEVVIETTVFLGHENDVIDALQAAVLVGRISGQAAAPTQQRDQAYQQ
jgi:hypothetical protein